MTEEFDLEAEALDAYLRNAQIPPSSDGKGQSSKPPGSLPPVPLEEARFAAELQNLSQTIQADPAFKARLEETLNQKHQRLARPPRRTARPGIWAVWAGLAVALLLGLVWVLSNLLPRAPMPAATAPIGPAVSTPAATETAPAMSETEPAAATPFPTLAVEAEGTIYSLANQPDVDFRLQAAFPEAPAEVPLYRQIAWPELTLENALETASRLGIAGQVYRTPFGLPGEQNLMVWEEGRQVTFYGSPRSFEYLSGNPALFERPDCEPPCMPPEAAGTLQTFLTESGLLDFEVQLSLSPGRPAAERIIQTLNGIPLLYRPGDAQGEGWVSSSGVVLRLDYHPANLEQAGMFPILSASQAWEAATSLNRVQGIELTGRSPFLLNVQNWQRRFPLDERVELFGNLQVFQSAQGGPPLLLLDGFELTGNTQGMVEASQSSRFLQVWGRFQQNGSGNRSLQVDGWQISPFPMQVLEGEIQLTGDRAYLATSDLTYLLPDFPSEIPAGKVMTASGVVIEQPELTLAWSSLSTGGGGGGGGGGGTGFSAINLEGSSTFPEATPATPNLSPMPGGRLEGETGSAYVVFHQYSDGSTEVEVFFHPEPAETALSREPLLLEGPGLAGIEIYHNLPIRIWGEISPEPRNGLTVVNLERFEPQFPGMSLETWLGRYEPASLDNQPVLLFTAQDGSQYVLGSSLEDPNIPLEFGPGDPIVLEGYVRPDQDVAGIPVITHLAVAPGQGLQDLTGYTPQSLTPMIVQETGTAGAALKATVEAVELAYYTQDPRYTDPAVVQGVRYVQPVWRFTGTYEDGSTFEILVQALAPQFLTPP